MIFSSKPSPAHKNEPGFACLSFGGVLFDRRAPLVGELRIRENVIMRDRCQTY